MPFTACPEKDPDSQRDMCTSFGKPKYLDAAEKLEYGTYQVCLCSQEAEWDLAFETNRFDVA